MKFRTEISNPVFKDKIGIQDYILLLGSCFTEHIGGRLNRFMLRTSVNPFGTIYNISSIANMLQKSIDGTAIDVGDIRYNPITGMYSHHDFHSVFNRSAKDQIVSDINRSLDQTRTFLENTNWLILTLGTAWVHERNGLVVNNCHKFPSSDFQKRCMTIEEHHILFNKLVETLCKVRPEIKILLTVSPVRHIKEGLSENSYSKSILRVFCEASCHQFTNVHYFPSYEIMMDDLRDYRFYQKDLIHPNDQAVDYIWSRFIHTMYSAEDLEGIGLIEKIMKGIEHKPFSSEADGYKKHLDYLENEIEIIQSKYPFMAGSLQDMMSKVRKR